MTADHQGNSPDHSLSIEEAAEHLGVSPATIRRRIKTGELGAYKRTTTYGFEWRILLEEDPAALSSSPDHQGPSVVQTPEQLVESADHLLVAERMKLLELLEAERRERAALVQRNEQLAGQLGFLQARVQEQERQIALLMAPKDEVAPQEPALVPQDAPAKLPWWRRWFG